MVSPGEVHASDPATEAGGAVDPPSSRGLLLRLIGLAVGVRVVLWVVGLWATGDLGSWLSLWSRWDAPHYLRIAQVGYRPWEPEVTGDDGLFIVFFPLFPLAVRLLAYAVRDLVLSGILVSLAASVGSGWFLYRLTRLDGDDARAWRAVLLLFAFPTAYFLAAPYTEALFLCAVLGAVYAARTGRWATAGGAGAAATATRISGLALLPALALEAWKARPHPRGWKGFAPLAMAPLGFVAYLTLNLVVQGDPFAFLQIQRMHWSQEAVWPWVPLADSVARIGSGGLRTDEVIIHWGRLAAAAGSGAVLLAGRRHLRRPDLVYGGAGLLFFLTASWLISLPRYVLVLYPLFMVGARWTGRRLVLAVVLGAGGALQVLLFARYAEGSWTF